MKKHFRVVFAVIFICLVVFLLIWKPILTLYCTNSMKQALSKIGEVGPNSSKQEYFIKRYEKYQARLVDLNYLAKAAINIENVLYSSKWAQALMTEMKQNLSPDGDILMGTPENNKLEIIIWDVPDNIDKLKEIVQIYDSLPSDEITIKDGDAKEYFAPFIGQWGSEDEGIQYIITEDHHLKVVKSDAEMWDTKIKNANFDGRCLSFDVFNFIEKSNAYKTIIDQSGNHPFNGVRLHKKLTTNPNNPSELIVEASSYQTETIRGIYNRIK